MLAIFFVLCCTFDKGPGSHIRLCTVELVIELKPGVSFFVVVVVHWRWNHWLNYRRALTQRLLHSYLSDNIC